MKSKLNLAISIFEIIMGILAMISFFYLAVRGDDMSNFIVALIVAIALILTGIAGIINYKKDKKIKDSKEESK